MEKDLIAKAKSFVEKSRIENSKIIIDNSNQTISITGEFEGSIITSDIKMMTNGYIRNTTQFSKKRKKSDYLNDVVELSNNGYKQIEIAQMLGISQPLVSQLLKKSKNLIEMEE